MTGEWAPGWEFIGEPQPGRPAFAAGQITLVPRSEGLYGVYVDGVLSFETPEAIAPVLLDMEPDGVIKWIHQRRLGVSG